MRAHIACIVLIAHAVASAKILGLFPHTGKSHQMVFDPLLRRLAEKGHHVTVVSFFPVKNPPANYTNISLESLAKLGVETIDLSWYESSNSILKMTGPEKIYEELTAMQPLSYMAVDVCSKLVGFEPLARTLRQDYDVILVENFNSDCMLGLAHIYGQKAPIIALLSSSLMDWSPSRIGVSDNPSYVPIVTSTFTTPMSFVQRLKNTVLNIYYKLWFRYAIQLKEKEIIENHYGRKIVDLEELARNTTLMFVNVHHSFNGVRPLLPGIVEVGGMHLDHKRKPIPEFFERFLNDSEHGVVLFSFGSLIKTSTLPKYKEDIIMKTLSQLKQRVIWKYEDSAEEGTLVGNVLKVKWIPQYDLLQHSKIIAFVGHGGLLGMTESISAGKPMLVIPFFGDQHLNGAQAEKIGFGKVVSYADLSEKTFLDGLQSVLSPEMRLSARRASNIWSDRQADPLDTAVYWTERVIRWGHRAPLHSPARDLPLHQYLLLDVAAAILVAILVLIAILRLIVVLIIRFFSGSVTAKEKLH
ncbi:UDP-glycosyltransferase UGT46A2 precursor [Bombyx mori]|uniref:UDP-glucuronosyltransferase n=1 Tax=Bombyx mori TaxID=7091 RepID=G9LPW1_BOMMO|nr:UDP-glycosyltransferase UGT46A2 precursor [Bombyx mori]AEW43184.1 UDP-glycosyltransferase UGT46A2 [Bombyx mori]